MWRTSNRGVILGLFLILILIIYVFVDKITFNNEKVLIKETITKYMDDYSSYISNTEEFCNSSGTWNDSLLKEKKEHITKILNDYWTDTFYTDTLNPWGQHSKSDMLNLVKELYDTSHYSIKTGYTRPIQYNISEMKITKNGPNGAKVSFDLRCKIIYQGTQYSVFFDGQIMSPNDYTYSNNDSDSLTEKTVILDTSPTFNLLRENGKWKLSDAQSYGYGISVQETATQPDKIEEVK